jgi:protein TonB
MNATVNTFPPFQSMNSPRVWVLALIGAMHLMFFWALMSGMGTRIAAALKSPPIQVVPVPPDTPVEPVRRHTPVEIERLVEPIFVPRPEVVDVDSALPDDKSVPLQASPDNPLPRGDDSRATTAPVVELPLIDPRLPLSEPTYPPAEIRLGHSGTVMLGVYVLPNGRIGEVRIEQSSGFPRLDMAAQHEARRWRLKPGTQDGRPIAMWKTIPITFQLKK